MGTHRNLPHLQYMIRLLIVLLPGITNLAFAQSGILQDPAKAKVMAEQAAIDFVVNQHDCMKGHVVVGVGESLAVFGEGTGFSSAKYFAFDLYPEKDKRYFAIVREHLFRNLKVPVVVWIERLFIDRDVFVKEYLESSNPQSNPAKYNLDEIERDEKKRRPFNFFPPFCAYAWVIGTPNSWVSSRLDHDMTQRVFIKNGKLEDAVLESDGDVTGIWKVGAVIWSVRFDKQSNMLPVEVIHRYDEGKKTIEEVLTAVPYATIKTVWEKQSDSVYRPIKVTIVQPERDTMTSEVLWNFHWISEKSIEFQLPTNDMADWRAVFMSKSQIKELIPGWLKAPQ